MITFAVKLDESEWNKSVGAWRCDVLRVAGAEVDSIHSDSARIEGKKYRVEADKAMIHWSDPEKKPIEITVFVRLSQELVTVEAQNTKLELQRQESEKKKARWKLAAFASGLLNIAATIGIAIYNKTPSATPPSSAPLAQAVPAASASGASTVVATASAVAAPPMLLDPSCPTVPPPDMKVPAQSFFMELARAPSSLPDVSTRVDAVANQVRGMLGADWKGQFAQSRTLRVTISNGTRQDTYSAGWYGMSQKNAADICCYLRSQHWSGEQDGVTKVCNPTPPDLFKPIPKTANSVK
jgi:hypothetical protein